MSSSLEQLEYEYLDGIPYYDYVHVMTPEDREMISTVFTGEVRDFILKKLIPNNMIFEGRTVLGEETLKPISELDDVLMDRIGFALDNATQYVKQRLDSFNRIMVIYISPDIRYEIKNTHMHGHMSSHWHAPLWNTDGSPGRPCRTVTIIIPISTPEDDTDDMVEFSSTTVDYSHMNYFTHFQTYSQRKIWQDSLELVEPTIKLPFPKEGKYLILDFNSSAIAHRSISTSNNSYVCLVVEY